MLYTLLLAGGKGTRMGNTGVPKQFMDIKGQPIIVRTLKKLLKQSKIDKIVIVCNKSYCAYLADLLQEYNLSKNIYVTEGGESRFDSIFSGIKYINENFHPESSDSFMIHDSVRPFIDDEVLSEAIDSSEKYPAISVANPLAINIISSDDEGNIVKIFPREKLYTDESPQIFNINTFMECIEKYTPEELAKVSDLSSVFVDNNHTVHIVEGNTDNIKITTSKDIAIAEKLISEED